MRIRTLLVSAAVVPVLVLVFSGCSGDRPVPGAEVERAQEIVQAFKQELVQTLATALDEGTPASAITVCADRAPEIARSHAVVGAEVGRTSHRLRNPDNAPDPWLEPILTDWVESPDTAEPTAVWIDEATIGYAEPIRMKSFCLICHGSAIEPELLETIRSLYPEDEAVGFHDGELRGAAWVTLPVGSEVTPSTSG